MEVYDETLYPDINDILKYIKNLSYKNKDKILYQECLIKVIKTYNGYYGYWDEIDLINKEIILKTQKKYEKLLDHSRKIISRMIIKDFLKKYIIHSLYSYPDGLRLKELKKNFYSQQEKLI